jgi:hypothetical protein
MYQLPQLPLCNKHKHEVLLWASVAIQHNKFPKSQSVTTIAAGNDVV